MFNKISKGLPLLWQHPRYHFSQGATFLSMVEGFFDRAAIHTGIRADRLAFYKKADSVVKCSIPLIRGNSIYIQTMAPLKPSPPIAANTKPINYQPKEAPAMQKM